MAVATSETSARVGVGATIIDSSICVATTTGFPSRREMVAGYEQRSGRSVQSLDWYVTLALWKAVVFMEGNYKRAISGSTDDPYLKDFGEGVVELAQRALSVTQQGL